VNELEPMDPLLRELVDAEREIPAIPPARRDRILAGVSAGVRLSKPGGGLGALASTGPWASRWIALVVAFVLGGGLGVWVGASLPQQPAPERPAPVAPPAPPAPRVAPAPSPAPAPPPAPTEEVEAAPRPRVTRTPRPDPDSMLAEERRLIEAARSAARSGNRAGAMDALERHAKQFPDGQLRQEREALARRLTQTNP